MKKNYVYLFLILHVFSYGCIIETERTIWHPWTIAHSKEWELMEKEDKSISYYRRNNYFESMEEMLLRDSNWLLFAKYAHNYFGENTLFPDLGFAIIRKTDQALIGTITIKISDLTGYLSFGYALIPEVRNHKLGQEIIKQLIAFSKTFIGYNIVTFSDTNGKNNFIKAWHHEGKKQDPDWEHLLSYFKQTTTPYLGITASVDISNKASLSVLISNGMQPYEIVCDRYKIDSDIIFFSFDFHLKFPASEPSVLQQFKTIIPDLLSRNNERILFAEQSIKNMFDIPDNWSYLQINRDEKAQLKVQEKISSIISLLSIDTSKNIHHQYRLTPYCFID